MDASVALSALRIRKSLDEQITDAARDVQLSMIEYQRAMLHWLTLCDRGGLVVGTPAWESALALAPDWLSASVARLESGGPVMAVNCGYMRFSVIGTRYRIHMPQRGRFNQLHLWSGSLHEERFRLVRDGSMDILNGVVQSRRTAVFEIGTVLDGTRMTYLELEMENGRFTEFEVLSGLHLQEGA